MNERASDFCYDADAFINMLRFQCSNRLFLIPFVVRHALAQLQDQAFQQENERIRLFWTREAFYVNEEIDVLSDLVQQADRLDKYMMLKPHALDALDALTITALSFKLLQIMHTFRQNKILRIDAYYDEHLTAQRSYITDQNFLHQQFVDEHFLLTTVLRNT
jgi:hypothetical protein